MSHVTCEPANGCATAPAAAASLAVKPSGAYRVIHSADWHLGKMLGEHSRQEEHERFLQFLLKAVGQFQADLLVIAGDVFDSANPPQSAMTLYYNFLSALFRQGGCSVVIVAGNHDSPANLEAPRQVLRALGAHVVGAWPEAPEQLLLPLPGPDSPQLVVAAVPFLRDRDLRTGESGQTSLEIERALAEGIKRRYEEVSRAAAKWSDQRIPILAMGHLAVKGSKAADSERQIHVGGLGAVGSDCFPNNFAYVALGHFHRPQEAGKRKNVRYAGSPIPLSFDEASDQKTICLLDFADGKLVAQAELPVPLARPLAQLRINGKSLEQVFSDFQPPPSELKCWVELVVEHAFGATNLYDDAQKLAKDKNFEVVRVVRVLRPNEQGPEGKSPAPLASDILSDPAKVFDKRLEAEPILTLEEKESLRTVFKELLDKHAELQRQNHD